MLFRPLLYLLVSLSSLPLAAREFYIDVSDEDLWDYPWSFGIDSIFDARENPEIAGYVAVGMANRPRLALLKKPLAQQFYRLLNKHAPKGLSQQFTIRINHLHIYEWSTATTEYGHAELNLSFLKKEGDGYVEVFEAAAKINQKGREVARWQEDNIVDALVQCLDDFEARQAFLNTRPFENESPPSRQYAIQVAEKFPKGIYHSFYDFRDHTPDTAIQFSVSHLSLKGEPYKRAEIEILTDTVLDHGIFGFSDGERLYLWDQKYSVQLVPQKGKFVLSEVPGARASMVEGLILNTLLGGVLGALVYTGTDFVDFDQYWLDLENSGMTSYRMEEAKKIQGQLIFYGSIFNEKDKAIQLFLNGELTCELPPAGYYIQRVDYPGDSLLVCLQYDGMEVCRQLSARMFNTDVYLTSFDRQGALLFERAEGNISGSVYREILSDYSFEVCPDELMSGGF